MDQTYSASGQRFYYALSQVWRDNPYASRYNLYVRETTRTRNGNRIVVFLDEREVQQVMLGSRLKDMTPLVASVEQRLNQLAMIRQSATPDMAANGY